MKRLLSVGAIFALAYFAQTARAQAIAEVCPAALFNATQSPSGEYMFALAAQGPRTVRATVALDTTMGWFTVTLPSVDLPVHDLHFHSSTAIFTRREWRSSSFGVILPAGAHVNHSYVAGAAVLSGQSGWPPGQDMPCSPTVGGSEAHSHPADSADLPRLDPKDVVDEGTPPIVAAKPSPPLQQSDCKRPFADAIATVAIPPSEPNGGTHFTVRATTTVQVVIMADGTVGDAAIYYPSGSPEFDQAALQAVYQSKFTSARAYCQNVPGYYFYLVTFTP